MNQLNLVFIIIFILLIFTNAKKEHAILSFGRKGMVTPTHITTTLAPKTLALPSITTLAPTTLITTLASTTTLAPTTSTTLAPTTLITTLAPKTFNTLYGIDYPGNDIKYLANTTVEQCKNECNTISGCIAAVSGTEGAGGHCWLKSKLENPVQNHFRQINYTSVPPAIGWKCIGKDGLRHDGYSGGLGINNVIDASNRCASWVSWCGNNGGCGVIPFTTSDWTSDLTFSSFTSKGYAIEQGVYNMAPWYLDFPDRTAKWIGKSGGIDNGATGNFVYIYTNTTGRNISAMLYVAMDDIGKVYHNNKLLKNINGWWSAQSTPIVLVSGQNNIIFSVTNSVGPSGVIFTCVDNVNKILFNSNSSTLLI